MNNTDVMVIEQGRLPMLKTWMQGRPLTEAAAEQIYFAVKNREVTYQLSAEDMREFKLLLTTATLR